MSTHITEITRACVSLTRTAFETVLVALEEDAGTRAREDAQDVLQSRAPRRWLQELEDAEDARRGLSR